MSPPRVEDYLSALMNPRKAFRREDYAGATVELHPIFGVPVPASGTSAVVFRANVRGADRALRFFLRDGVSTRARYEAVDTHVVRHGLLDDIARARWLDDAITVNGNTWPLVETDWIVGRTLDAYVEHIGTQSGPSAIAGLADQWRHLVARLQGNGFAHGGLSHKHVLVDDYGRLRLIDLDSAWVEQLTDTRGPDELGHPNFAPARTTWGRWMDTGPALLIYTSLRALALEPALWREYYNGNNLIFRQADLDGLFKTPLWTALDDLRDPAIDRLVRSLTMLNFDSPTRGTSMQAMLTGDADAAVVAARAPTPSPGPEAARDGVFAWPGPRNALQSSSRPDGPPRESEQYVFVSYAREDQARVRELVAHLRDEGHSAWLDTTGTVAGRDWTEQIVAAIRRSSALVLVISPHSMASKAVRREVQYADDHDLTVIPVVFEEVTLPDWYRFAFAYVHRIDAADGSALRQAARAIVAALGGG